MRQIFLDTETTGLNPRTGDRVIEIGCVELVNRQLTGNNFHRYINPERESDPGALAVHGLTSDFLSDKPKFSAVIAELWTKELSSWTAHRVTAAREKIETIAAKFKTTPQVIREANDIPPNMHVKAGSVLLVPKLATTSDKDISDEVVNNATMNVEPDGPAKRRITIKVSKHDDLKSIAQRYKVTEAQIREWNDLKGKKIVTGQSLKLEVRAGKAKSKNGKTEKTGRTSKSSSNKHSH